jgi:gliding motility-associated-like protein
MYVRDTPTVETIINWGDGGQTAGVTGRHDTIYHLYESVDDFFITAYGKDVLSPAQSGCRITPVYPDTVRGDDKIRVGIITPFVKVALTDNKDIYCAKEAVTFINSSDTSMIQWYNYTAYIDSVFFDSIAGVMRDTFIIANTPNEIPNFWPQLDHYPNEMPEHFPHPFNDSGYYKFVITVPTTGFKTVDNGGPVPVNAVNSCASALGDSVFFTVNKVKAAVSVVSDQPNFKFIADSSSYNVKSFDWEIYRGKSLSGADRIKTHHDERPNTRWEIDMVDDTGDFIVCVNVTAYEKYGSCPDSACAPFRNTYSTNVIIPNVFSPNGDGSNETFKIAMESEQQYHLKIFNRWGGLVFESWAKDMQWNGKLNNTGTECPPGAYYFIFEYKLRGADPNAAHGTVTLIR